MKTIKFTLKNINNNPSVGGLYNGYVAITIDSNLFGIYYDDISKNIDIHGGLTFSENGKGLRNCEDIPMDIYENPLDYWIFGFDTLHLGDEGKFQERKDLFDEINKLEKQLILLNKKILHSNKNDLSKEDKKIIIKALDIIN